MSMKQYFGKEWKPSWDRFVYTGIEGLTKSIDKNARILDIGCGYNDLKEYFPNLYGIDPYNDAADEVVSWEKFDPKGKEFDVFLCLGSINFGTYKKIDKQIAKLAEMCKPKRRVYWRQNPGLTSTRWKGSEKINFFPWSKDYNVLFTKQYGFQIVNQGVDGGDRLYYEWQKL